MSGKHLVTGAVALAMGVVIGLTGTAWTQGRHPHIAAAQRDLAAAEKQLSESLAAAPRSPVVATALAKAWSRENGAGFAGERLMRLAERDPGLAFARLIVPAVGDQLLVLANAIGNTILPNRARGLAKLVACLLTVLFRAGLLTDSFLLLRCEMQKRQEIGLPARPGFRT